MNETHYSYVNSTLWMRKRDVGFIVARPDDSGGWSFNVFTGDTITSTVIVNYEQMLAFLKEVEDGKR